MLFNSLEFLIFLPTMLLIYWRLNHENQNHLLLVGSYIFYGMWDYRFLALLTFSTIFDFYAGRLIHRAQQQESPQSHLLARRYLIASCVVNLTLLGVFKYYDFFILSFEEVLQAFGVSASLPLLRVILPVGISFYTFQSMSYTIDVYRQELKPTDRLSEFALYVSFFPQLVAGPIERGKTLIGQVIAPRHRDGEREVEGIHLCFWGFFKKVFIADNLSPIVDQVFASNSATGFEVVLGVYAFAVQIYCDFSGYTDIARGVAKLFGFELMLNFNLPYFATSPSDFWRRWHISLSGWLRDYLYIPLGGSRGSFAFTSRNLMITMLLGGLWHGAAWNFVLWGLYHGTLLVAFRAAERTPLGRMADRLPAWIKVVAMFQITCYGWLLFRAGSFEQIRSFSLALVQNFGVVQWDAAAQVGWLVAPLLIVQLIQAASGRLLFLDWPWARAEYKTVCYACMLYVILFHGATSQSFIYFQF